MEWRALSARSRRRRVQTAKGNPGLRSEAKVMTGLDPPDATRVVSGLRNETVEADSARPGFSWAASERAEMRPRPSQSPLWTKFGLGDNDVLLGFGLVAAYCAFVVVALAMSLGGIHGAPAVVVLGLTMAVNSGLLALSGRRLKGRWLLCFPALLVASELALSLLEPAGRVVEFTGFFTLVFVFIGLTQRRGIGPIFVLATAPVWAVIELPWSGEVGVKCVLTLTIWLLISEVLAARTDRMRIRTKRLVALVNTDVLTGLGSRLYLSDCIERVVRRADGPSSTLLSMNLDGFKTVNDAYGHAAGDELLVAVARRLESVLESGDMAARLGGDDFVALFEGCDLDRTMRRAQDLLTRLNEPYGLSQSRVAITASIGIVGILPPATAELVLRQADRAVSEAKSEGRNRVSVHEGAMEERTIQRLKLETQVRDALANEQFEVHYQPVVHTGMDTIIGAEALVRWRHPERGLLAPDQFLAVAEDIGVIGPLGDWVLRQACRQAQRWQSIDPARAFSVAVNLSAPEMFSADLVSRVRSALEESGLAGTLLVLEITEGIIMADTEQATRQLAELRKLGVRIAIDDFGTGYSSLAYARELPVDILKIDRSFIKPLEVDLQAVALVRAIVGIAKALDLDVIVEGVETTAQLELLTDLGCDVVQGFYYGRPTSEAELEGRLLRSHAGVIDR
jgi:diguanylate cyclase (GGDEF)-like protein